LTWLFNNSDAEATLNKKLASEGATSVLLGKDTKESNRLHKAWRKSRFCKDIDKLLSGGGIGEVDERSSDSEEENSDTEEAARQEPPATSLAHAIDDQQETVVSPRGNLSAGLPLRDEVSLTQFIDSLRNLSSLPCPTAR
jgi:hypothetical protein